MRVCFIGASGFGLRCLERLRRLPCCEVVGAVSAPQTFSISYRPEGVTNVLFADVKNFCDQQGIECMVMTGNMREPALMERVRAWSPDAFMVAGWYHLLPKSWRQIAPAYGLHASLLPDYSGGAPLVWCMINGEPATGITLFQLAEGVDDGPLIAQARTDILPEDTIASLYARIELLGLDLLERYLPALADGSAVLTTQDERNRRVFPQRSPADGAIDWNQSSRRVHDFIRAQTRPYPGAFATIDDVKFTIWSSSDRGAVDCQLAAGELQPFGDTLLAGCANATAVALHQVQVDGVDMHALKWWNERRR